MTDMSLSSSTTVTNDFVKACNGKLGMCYRERNTNNISPNRTTQFCLQLRKIHLLPGPNTC